MEPQRGGFEVRFICTFIGILNHKRKFTFFFVLCYSYENNPRTTLVYLTIRVFKNIAVGNE